MTTSSFVFNSNGEQLTQQVELDLILDAIALIEQQDSDTLSARIEKIAAINKDTNKIGIRFDKFTDGRSYSIAARLREAGFAGELHALGEINQELVFLLKRVGFTHFHIPDPGTDVLAENMIRPFAGHYQAAQDGTLAPWQIQA